MHLEIHHRKRWEWVRPTPNNPVVSGEETRPLHPDYEELVLVKRLIDKESITVFDIPDTEMERMADDRAWQVNESRTAKHHRDALVRHIVDTFHDHIVPLDHFDYIEVKGNKALEKAINKELGLSK